MLINGFCAASSGGSASALPLCWWQGWSGRWYVASAMPLDRLSCRAPGFFLLVRRSGLGDLAPVALGSAGDVEADLTGPSADELIRAVAAGANEIHVNLIADGAFERDAAVADLARGWNVPLLGARPV